MSENYNPKTMTLEEMVAEYKSYYDVARGPMTDEQRVRRDDLRLMIEQEDPTEIPRLDDWHATEILRLLKLMNQSEDSIDVFVKVMHTMPYDAEPILLDILRHPTNALPWIGTLGRRPGGAEALAQMESMFPEVKTEMFRLLNRCPGLDDVIDDGNTN